MPIQTSDIKFRLSVKTGSAGNSTAQGDPNQSLGKYMSTTDMVDNTLNNLLDKVTGDENAAGAVDYRCVFVYNTHSTLTYEGVKLWVSGVRFAATDAGDLFTANGHGYANGDTVRLDAEFATDALPAGVNNSTTYYVVGATTNTFQLSATQGGAAVTLTSDGSGAARKYGHTSVALSIDDIAASSAGSASAQAAQVANEAAAPTGVGAFSAPTTKAGGLNLGDIGPGQCRAFWVRRTALNSVAFNNDGLSWQCSGDTAA